MSDAPDAPIGDEVAEHLDRVEEEKLADLDIREDDKVEPEAVGLDREAPSS